MLGNVLPVAWPFPARVHDHLFAPSPEGATVPARYLAGIYAIYRDALPDEPAPPCYKHFNTLAEQIVGLGAPIEAASGLELKRLRSAYTCCFERSERFLAALPQWRHDPEFKQRLEEIRQRLIADLIPYRAEEKAQRARLSRYWECMQAPIDIAGETLLDLVQQMSPDDWHEMVLRWDWDDGVAELDWITSQPDCDRATALLALCRGNPGYVATHSRPPEPEGRWDVNGFVLAVASRLENGFYMKAELGLELKLRMRAAFARELELARDTGVSPWQIPGELLDHEGVRGHQPKYTLSGGAVHYHYDHWLTHIARPQRQRSIHRFIGLLKPP